MNMTHEELRNKVIHWASARGLLNTIGSSGFELKARGQFLKLTEELGELAAALARQDYEAVRDAIGDLQVVLIILSDQLGLNSTECLSHAWEEIKSRKGKTENGVFVKEGE